MGLLDFRNGGARVLIWVLKFRVRKTILCLIFLCPLKPIFSLKTCGGQLIIWGL